MGWCDPVASDKHYWHRYSGFYQRHFTAIGSVGSILEYGVLDGASIGWLRALFPQAAIVGADILAPQPDWPRDDRIGYVTLDQGDRIGVAGMLRGLDRRFDLVIEDGSHIPQHQAICLAETFPFVRPGGLYVLEDLHTSHPQHPYYRTHCLAGTPTSLHLLLLLEHKLATSGTLSAEQCRQLSRPELFREGDIRRLDAAIAAVDIYHRATLPLRCYACGADDIDPVALRCRCGVGLDFLGADSITAVLRAA